jgi:hypothetical protein
MRLPTKIMISRFPKHPEHPGEDVEDRDDELDIKRS